MDFILIFNAAISFGLRLIEDSKEAFGRQEMQH
jgi:hypothetical protein